MPPLQLPMTVAIRDNLDAPKRRRASKPKVRTGCIVCKIRRIKCDETKPSCNKCTSTGRKCDGYEEARKPEATAKHRQRQAESQAPVTRSLTPGSNKIPIPRQPCLLILPSDDSANMSFDYFRLNTIASIAGGSDYRLWTSIVFQLSNSIPAVRLAAAALGSLSRRMQLIDTYRARNQLSVAVEHANALQSRAEVEYARALRSLREQLGLSSSMSDDEAAETGLVSCWLMHAFEFLRGNAQPAIVHQVSGMAVLQRHLKHTEDRGSGSRISSLRTQITKVFDAWDQRTTVWLGLDRTLTDYITEKEDPSALPVTALLNRQWIFLSNGINNLRDASLSQRQIVIAVMFLRHQLNSWLTLRNDETLPDMGIERARILGVLEAWQAAFRVFAEENEAAFTVHERHWATLLDVNARATNIRVRVLLNPNEMTVYRSRPAELESLLNLIGCLIAPENIMKGRNSDFDLISDDRGAANFNLGLIQPLYHVAVKSPLAEQRKRALHMLESDPWEEESFNSAQVAQIARRHIDARGRTQLSGLRNEDLEPGYYHLGHMVPMTI